LGGANELEVKSPLWFMKSEMYRYVGMIIILTTRDKLMASFTFIKMHLRAIGSMYNVPACQALFNEVDHVNTNLG